MSREAEQVESPFVVFHVDTHDMLSLAKHFSYVRSFTRNTQEEEGARTTSGEDGGIKHAKADMQSTHTSHIVACSLFVGFLFSSVWIDWRRDVSLSTHNYLLSEKKPTDLLIIFSFSLAPHIST